MRSGSFTSSAGTVADSRPMKAHRVSPIAAVMPSMNVRAPRPTVGASIVNGVKWSPTMKKIPTTPINASGTNFRIVVTAWTHPPCLTPKALTNVRSQTAPIANSAMPICVVPRSGQITVTYPTNAVAIAAFPTHAAIQ